MTPEERERYARHILLREVGGQGQQKLLAARVLVVGAGGLGSPILSYLAAAGVGLLGIADDDVVSLSNLQRQTLFRTEDVGRDKVEAAREAIARLNPHVKSDAHPRVTEENARKIVSGYDLVVEGVDNFAARYALNRACIAEKTPLVSAAVGRFEGQLSTFKPFADPGVLPCYRCLVPEEPPREEQVNCAEEGVLGAVTGVMGTLAAMEVLKELLSVGDSLAGRLMLYDGLGGAFRTVKLPADPACPDCSVHG
ncbi:HesA/MoeB/ThiF family protein [Hyphococcus luteus]|uniref:Molybdopterin-synthase adenylyltransferase n=1 Tax=Hyphococcus luteus TaxID=2058213 RepID=A0A2S7K7E8_9PROT|nr:molybdopterin-synthase adenylyltransferase MoeB [Marinicaulis flavus]PQA88420.1 adenylyltransferase [Marinicaulis flavus]